ncbi:MAG: phage virion morphogenesis protein [Bacteroidetes bacterium]|nr:phage virion morphogenesis protein [Bacteroidota bacterium]
MPVYGIKNLNDRLHRMRNDLYTKIPKRIGQDAENHFRDSFKKGGFTDRAFVPWKPRARPPRTKSGKEKPHTILYNHGLLRNSVRLVRFDWNNIQVIAGGPHVPYAQIHNEGGTISKTVSVRGFDRRAHLRRTKRGKRVRVGPSTVGAYTRHMHTVIPRRQFMGNSYELRQTMRKTILRTIAEAANR